MRSLHKHCVDVGSRRFTTSSQQKAPWIDSLITEGIGSGLVGSIGGFSVSLIKNYYYRSPHWSYDRNSLHEDIAEAAFAGFGSGLGGLALGLPGILAGFVIGLGIGSREGPSLVRKWKEAKRLQELRNGL